MNDVMRYLKKVAPHLKCYVAREGRVGHFNSSCSWSDAELTSELLEISEIAELGELCGACARHGRSTLARIIAMGHRLLKVENLLSASPFDALGRVERLGEITPSLARLKSIDPELQAVSDDLALRCKASAEEDRAWLCSDAGRRSVLEAHGMADSRPGVLVVARQVGTGITKGQEHVYAALMAFGHQAPTGDSCLWMVAAMPRPLFDALAPLPNWETMICALSEHDTEAVVDTALSLFEPRSESFGTPRLALLAARALEHQVR